MTLLPPLPRYEQVAAQLRDQVLDGTWPEGTVIPSGPELAKQAGVSQNLVQKAFDLLAREGLLTPVQGARTTVPPRKTWHVTFTARVTADAQPKAREEIEARLAGARPQPAITATETTTSDGAARLVATVESATPDGAIAAAAPIAAHAFSDLPVTSITAAEA